MQTRNISRTPKVCTDIFSPNSTYAILCSLRMSGLQVYDIEQSRIGQSSGGNYAKTLHASRTPYQKSRVMMCVRMSRLAS